MDPTGTWPILISQIIITIAVLVEAYGYKPTSVSLWRKFFVYRILTEFSVYALWYFIITDDPLCLFIIYAFTMARLMFTILTRFVFDTVKEQLVHSPAVQNIAPGKIVWLAQRPFVSINTPSGNYHAEISSELLTFSNLEKALHTSNLRVTPHQAKESVVMGSPFNIATNRPDYLINIVDDVSGEVLGMAFRTSYKKVDVLVTATHVLRTARSYGPNLFLSNGLVTLNVGSPKIVFVSPYLEDKGYDVTMIELSTKAVTLLKVKQIPMSRQAPRKFVTTIYGYCSEQLTYSTGPVMSGTDTLKYLASTTASWSGSPIVHNRKVVGIHVQSGVNGSFNVGSRFSFLKRSVLESPTIEDERDYDVDTPEYDEAALEEADNFYLSLSKEYEEEQHFNFDDDSMFLDIDQDPVEIEETTHRDLHCVKQYGERFQNRPVTVAKFKSGHQTYKTATIEVEDFPVDTFSDFEPRQHIEEGSLDSLSKQEIHQMEQAAKSIEKRLKHVPKRVAKRITQQVEQVSTVLKGPEPTTEKIELATQPSVGKKTEAKNKINSFKPKEDPFGLDSIKLDSLNEKEAKIFQFVLDPKESFSGNLLMFSDMSTLVSWYNMLPKRKNVCQSCNIEKDIAFQQSMFVLCYECCVNVLAGNMSPNLLKKVQSGQISIWCPRVRPVLVATEILNTHNKSFYPLNFQVQLEPISTSLPPRPKTDDPVVSKEVQQNQTKDHVNSLISQSILARVQTQVEKPNFSYFDNPEVLDNTPWVPKTANPGKLEVPSKPLPNIPAASPTMLAKPVVTITQPVVKESKTATHLHCNTCDRNNSGGSIFCNFCGNPLKLHSVETLAAPPQSVVQPHSGPANKSSKKKTSLKQPIPLAPSSGETVLQTLNLKDQTSSLIPTKN
jgi:hypothetical protein